MSQALFLFGAIVLVIFLVENSTNSNITDFRVPFKHFKSRNKSEETVTVKFDELVSECEQNMSVINITDFDSFPDHIKTFMYYQHCRFFPMLLNVPDKCGEGSTGSSTDVFLLLVIKSSPGNYVRREVLRKTWAKERRHKGVWIRRIFISGTSGEGLEKAKLNKLLRTEQQEFSDILQWDFTDTFHNLTLKQMLFLQWMEKSCPNARFLFNGDDDVFANTDNIVEYLQSLDDNDGSKHLFTGFLFQNEKVSRWSPSKYYVPIQIQKEDHYLPYCGGGGYMLSGFTAMVIHKMSQYIPLHPIDDAYVGMCLARAGLSPSSHIGVKTLGLNLPSAEEDTEPCYLRQLLIVHQYFPAQIYAMWRQVHDSNLQCSPSMKHNRHNGAKPVSKSL